MMKQLSEPIAVIGMAGRFPGAADVDEFWRNLRAGTESVHQATDEELLAAGVPAEALRDPNYVKAVAMAPGIEDFDAEFFDMTPREAELCDPQIKLFLETSHAALENAGYDPFRLRDVGVFGSAGVNRYVDLHVRAAKDTVRSASGMSLGVLSNPDYVATLVSYKYNYRGPSMTVQTACSSSLVAVHLAAQALRNGECEIALAGGSDVEFPLAHGHWWASGSPLSRDGHCRPFDSGATGTVFGSGVGVVVVKRLSQALADGDHIRAVVRSMAINNDGSGKVGFSAPSVAGQAAVITEAMAVEEIAPAAVSYVEAHATGTVLGDPIEVAALNQAYRDLATAELEPGGCALGSVKGNIGHLGHAAGIASLMKVVLSLENESIPPTVNYHEANPKLELDGSPFRVVDALRPWPRVAGNPRLAGINSLGIGGTNVHAVLEEAPVGEASAPDGRPRLVVWSGASRAAELAYRERLAGFLNGRDADFVDATATLQRGRTAHGVRAAVVASNAAEAVAALDSGSVIDSHGRSPHEVTFLLPGQGAQHLGMARGLYAGNKVFATALDECFDLFRGHGIDIRQAWQDATGDDDLEPTALAQPLIFAVSHAATRMWSDLGLRPAAVLGHSVGELTAAAVAGVFDLADAVALVAARSRAMEQAPAGAMLAVAADADAVRGVLTEGVDIAVSNGPAQTVVAGRTEAVEEFRARLGEHGLRAQRVRASHAFHSPLMATAAEQFENAFDGVVLKPPSVPLFSAATGAEMSPDEATSPAFWARQLVDPVRFDAALDSLLSGTGRLLLEVGPGRTLTSLVKQHPATAGGDHLVVPAMPRQHTDPASERRSLLNAVGQVWTDGHTVDWETLEQDAAFRRVVVPGYPYQRVRHWIDMEPERQPEREVVAPAAQVRPEAPAAMEDKKDKEDKAEEVSAFSTVGWTEAVRPAADPGEPAGLAVALLPPDRERALDTVALLHQAGLRVVPVHPGDAYQESGGGFRARPGDAEDLRRVFQALGRRESHPTLLLHATTLGPWERPSAASAEAQLQSSFHSLHELIKQGMRGAASGQLPGLLVLTERSADVSGDEVVDPLKATLHGVVRTHAEEQPQTTAKLVDAPGDVDQGELIEEIRRWRRSEIVALRGDRRWVQGERAYTPPQSGHAALRRDGVYVVTGGFGALGRVVARELAGTGLRPRLILLGRTVPADVDTIVEELESLGARVRALSCDVTDARAVRRAVDIGTATFGDVNGVLHLAGVAGDGMLQFRAREQCEGVFAPKVHGTLVLQEVFAARPALDFFVCFSSRAALGGLVGGGDYAAANAFLDAWVRTPPRNGCRVLSVNWPSWTSAGMAAAGLAAAPAAAPVSASARMWSMMLSAETTPVLDEHRIGGVPVLPGTGHLEFVVRAFRSEVLGGAAGPVRLADVVFQRPLAAPDRRVVRVVLEPDGRWWRFRIDSDPAEPQDGGTQTHAVGKIAAADDATPRQVDLGELAHVLTERGGPPRKAARGLVTQGPRWNNVNDVRSRPGDGGEQLLTLALPEPYAADAGEYELHPALLDSATSYARDSEREEPHLPFMYRTMVVHAPLPPRLSSHIRRREASDGMIVADVDLLDQDGRVLVEINGYTMRRVQEEPAAFISSLEGRPQEPAGRGEESAPPVGIPPEVGGRLFMELLTARTSRQVAVRPFRDGRPTPVAGTSAGAPLLPTGRARVTPADPVEPAPAQLPQAPVVEAPAEAPAPAGTSSSAGATSSTSSPPSSSIHDRLRALWAQTLGIKDVDGAADFFDLGGNSLSAVELMSDIEATFDVELSIAALFDFPTLDLLADELRRLGAE